MITSLKLIVPGTEFTLNSNGTKWRKGSTTWCPRAETCSYHPEFKEHLDGKPCTKCSPLLGGQFQDKLEEFILDEAEVTVS